MRGTCHRLDVGPIQAVVWSRHSQAKSAISCMTWARILVAPPPSHPEEVFQARLLEGIMCVELLLDKGGWNAHFARWAGEHCLSLVAPRRILAFVRQPALLDVFRRPPSAGLRRRSPLVSRRWRSGAWHVFVPRGHISMKAVAPSRRPSS